MKAITLSLEPARRELQVCHEPQLVYALLTARTETREQLSLPLNLGLVLDRSSSMRGARLWHLKQAVRQLLDELTPIDAFSLVVFNDRAETIVPAQRVHDAEALFAPLNAVDGRGGTEMAQGLAAGLQELDRFQSGGLNHLILLTDGRTYGDELACVELARRAGERGIGLTVLGLGTEWNEDLLEQMAAGINCRTQYLATESDIVPVFDAELKRLRATIARNAQLLCALHPASQIRSLHRVQPFVAPLQPHALGGGRWHVPLGLWAGGADQQFLFELVVPPVGPGAHPVARIELRYELGSTPESVGVMLQQPAVAAPHHAIAADARAALERVFAFQLQQRAWQAVAEGRLDDATKRLHVAGTHLFNAGERALAETVHAEAARLLQSGAASAGGRKRIKYGTRGLVADHLIP